MHFLDAFVEPAVWFLADWSLRWAALIGVAMLLLIILRPHRADVRHLICMVSLLGGLLIPLAPRWGDGWRPRVEWEIASLPADPKPQPIRNYSPTPSPPIIPRTKAKRIEFPDAPRETPVRTNSDHPEATAAPSAERWGSRRIFIAVTALFWCIGALALSFRWICGYWFLRRLRYGSEEISRAAADVFAACRGEIGVRDAVRLAAHPLVRSPVLIGLIRPLILVPLDWPCLPADVQRAGLLHELAHVRRRDHWLAPLLHLLRVGFFFHPFVHWLLTRLEREREWLCDEMVVARGIDRRDYARILLEFARQSGRFALPRFSGLPIGRRRTIKARIHHLLEENMERWISPLPRRWAALLGIALLTLGLGAASYRVMAVEEKQRNAESEQKKRKRIAVEEEEPVKKVKKTARGQKREELRYGGKDFNEWRTNLLTELKGSIRVDGMKAFAAFGANGYAQEATQAILDMIRGYNVANFEAAFEDDYRVVEAAEKAIKRIGAETVPALTTAVKSDNRNVRRFAIQALASQGTDAVSAIPALLRAMKHKDSETRRRAMLAINSIDRLAKGYVDALAEAINDKANQYQVIMLIQSIGEKAHPAVPALLEALSKKTKKIEGL